MDRPTLLILVRHGESQHNVAKQGQVYFADSETRALIDGKPDYQIPLTDQGRQQATATGRWLRQRFGTFDYSYHTGYERTADTLEHILQAYPEPERRTIKVRMNPFIRERDPGYAYHMTKEEAEDNFPWLHEHWEMFGSFFARPPGGESLSDVTSRVYNFLDMLFRDRAGQKVLVVTHGGTLRCFRFLLERWTYEQALHWPEGQNPANCGITVYRYNKAEHRLVLQEYNSVAPLDSTESP